MHLGFLDHYHNANTGDYLIIAESGRGWKIVWTGTSMGLDCISTLWDNQYYTMGQPIVIDKLHNVFNRNIQWSKQ